MQFNREQIHKLIEFEKHQYEVTQLRTSLTFIIWLGGFLIVSLQTLLEKKLNYTLWLILLGFTLMGIATFVIWLISYKNKQQKYIKQLKFLYDHLIQKIH